MLMQIVLGNPCHIKTKNKTDLMIDLLTSRLMFGSRDF